jgi:hypothetical protein
MEEIDNLQFPQETMLANLSTTQFDHTPHQTALETTPEHANAYKPYDENLTERSFDGMLDLEGCGGSDQQSVGEQHGVSSSPLDQSGGRDSGISTESYKYQDFFTKVC